MAKFNVQAPNISPFVSRGDGGAGGGAVAAAAQSMLGQFLQMKAQRESRDFRERMVAEEREYGAGVRAENRAFQVGQTQEARGFQREQTEEYRGFAREMRDEGRVYAEGRQAEGRVYEEEQYAERTEGSQRFRQQMARESVDLSMDLALRKYEFEGEQLAKLQELTKGTADLIIQIEADKDRSPMQKIVFDPRVWLSGGHEISDEEIKAFVTGSRGMTDPATGELNDAGKAAMKIWDGKHEISFRDPEKMTAMGDAVDAYVREMAGDDPHQLQAGLEWAEQFMDIRYQDLPDRVEASMKEMKKIQDTISRNAPATVRSMQVPSPTYGGIFTGGGVTELMTKDKQPLSPAAANAWDVHGPSVMEGEMIPFGLESAETLLADSGISQAFLGVLRNENIQMKVVPSGDGYRVKFQAPRGSRTSSKWLEQLSAMANGNPTVQARFVGFMITYGQGTEAEWEAIGLKELGTQAGGEAGTPEQPGMSAEDQAARKSQVLQDLEEMEKEWRVPR